jgi:hypothetical protein
LRGFETASRSGRHPSRRREKLRNNPEEVPKS